MLVSNVIKPLDKIFTSATEEFNEIIARGTELYSHLVFFFKYVLT